MAFTHILHHDYSMKNIIGCRRIGNYQVLNKDNADRSTYQFFSPPPMIDYSKQEGIGIKLTLDNSFRIS